MTGFGDQQTKVGPAIADNYSGTYLALGIAMALYQRSKTGMGRRLDVSMVDTIFSILEAGAVEYTINGHISGPEGNRDPGISPFDSFHAKDGSFVMACGTDGFWKSLCGLMKRLDLVDDPRFVTNAKRCENYLSELKSIISAWAVNYTVDEMEEMLVGAGIPFGRILTMDQVCAQDVLRDRNMLWTVKDTGIGEEIEIPGSPIKMHGCADMAMRSAPVVGEHTDSILRDVLGMDDAQITQLHNDHVV